eukprot:TRINITY_DN80337_c0_g1_i1.p1 TRINITY_DN80337_c0_g1~~TRINITY_DN80337_c0_g1_i1.p1  ORF type:complete len:729 (+),score=77.72 TRINITY_DN80337_c0_g1_i1:65-2251(+)
MLLLRVGIFLNLWPCFKAAWPTDWKWPPEGPEHVDCPCVTNSSAQWSALQAKLIAEGLPTEYGSIGCRAYDKNNTDQGCFKNKHEYCLEAWCFVDLEECVIDSQKCLAAGGKVGSDVSPYCRDRPHAPSLALNSTVYRYSFETCGRLNTFDEKHTREALSDRVIKAALDPWGAWVVAKDDPRSGTVYEGILYDFFVQVTGIYGAGFEIQHEQGWATPESRALFSSSYTACAYDVAIGNFDICIADMWRTPERSLYTEFTPDVRDDHFYLIVPRAVKDDTMLTKLKQPFAPFTVEAWVAIAGIMCFMTCILWIMDLRPEDNEGIYHWRTTNPRIFVNDFWDRFLLLVTHFFGGDGPPHSDLLQYQFFRLGLAFFVLVIITSYTASLASLLVVQRQAAGAISGIDKAIEQKLTICVAASVADGFKQSYPDANWLPTPFPEIPRALYAGRCQVAVKSEADIERLYSGGYQDDDCKQVAEGTLAEEESHCTVGFARRPRNDCDFVRVGDIVSSIPVAFPVNGKFAHSLAWAFAQAKSEGAWEMSLVKNAQYKLKSKCTEEQRSEEDGMGLDDLSGAMWITAVFVVMGLISFLWKQVKHLCPLCTRGGEKVRWSMADAEVPAEDRGMAESESGKQETTTDATLNLVEVDSIIFEVAEENEAQEESTQGSKQLASQPGSNTRAIEEEPDVPAGPPGSAGPVIRFASSTTARRGASTGAVPPAPTSPPSTLAVTV